MCSFLEEIAPYDSTDSAADAILMTGTLNTDDIFVVSSYPRTGNDKLRMISYIRYTGRFAQLELLYRSLNFF